MEDKNTESTLHKAASTANALRGAAKTGKMMSKAAKGAAAGGPYGMLAVGLWENRHLLLKILAAAACILMLPILFIMMLPSLIFGGFLKDEASDNTLNNNTAIMQNIADAESVIEEILREKHGIILDVIRQEAGRLGNDCEYSITDEFADTIIFESTLLISQFCASKENYLEINLENLKGMLLEGTGHIFSYRTNVTGREVTLNGETKTIYHYEYILEYAGDTYFADNVFHLTEEQAALAADYASNLHLFLYNTVYQVTVNPDLLPGETGNLAVDLALTKLGIPYSQDLRNQEGYFDCSSFTYWVYNQLGIQLIHDGANTAAAQGRFITEHNLAVSYDNLAPGDLIFYSFGVNNRYLNIDHVAIYCGDGYVADASSSKMKVVYRPIFSTNHIVLCGRPYAGL